MQQILDAIMQAERATDPAAELRAVAGLPVPSSYRGVVVRADETDMFDGLATRDKDPRKSLHVQEVPTPEVGPGEALIAVMGSAVNYNTVWTSIFEPVSTFGFLQRYGRLNDLSKRHDLPYHVVGSDAAGVVLKVGAGVSKWKPGDEVVAHCLSVELEDATGHDDTMLDPQQRIWASRPTSAAWPSWPWSRPTSSCRSRPTCPGRRRPAPGWSTPPRTASSSPTTARR